ncbi:unnamed protein product [Linum tenue]|uniref:Uncharacterized protein n=1 Tax=Linum tenue TaxID=586396 RepID=A0AAV0RX24_9ROSI|nr:unnamed protein product [Linum tenue]
MLGYADDEGGRGSSPTMSSTPSRRSIFATIFVVVSSTRWGNEREDRGPSSSPRSIFATTSWAFSALESMSPLHFISPLLV